MKREKFHEFYLGYLSFLEGRCYQGSELIYRVINYSMEGKETGNPRKVYKIEREVLYIEELSERNLFSQCTEEELYVIYEHFEGDLDKIRHAQPRKEKLLDTFHNLIEFKRPILLDMLENYLRVFERVY